MIRAESPWQKRLVTLAEMRIHYLQHVAMEDPGSILAWASEQGCSLTYTLFHESGALPAVDSFDWLLILGGPMNIYEEERFPWLAEEKLFIRSAIAAGKIVIGLCLGAQLIADVIGGQVTANREPEIGWLPVRWSAKAREHPLFSFFLKPLSCLNGIMTPSALCRPGRRFLPEAMRALINSLFTTNGFSDSSSIWRLHE